MDESVSTLSEREDATFKRTPTSSHTHSVGKDEGSLGVTHPDEPTAVMEMCLMVQQAPH